MLIPLSKDATSEMAKFGLALYYPANDRFMRVGAIDTVSAVRRRDGTSEIVLLCRGEQVAGFCLAPEDAARLANVVLDLKEEPADRVMNQVLDTITHPTHVARREVRERLGDLVPEFD